MTVTPATIEEIRVRMDIVDIISEHVTLKKSGKHWMGLCPFHNEKTPSFHVNRDKQIFKCFGCGAGGDGFSFLQKVSGHTFMDVVLDLANKFGIQTEQSSPKFEFRSKIYDVNKLAVEFFSDNLLNSEAGQKAKQYLNQRGISDEIISRFNLGYAPAGWDNLLKFLSKENNINVQLIEDAGLITRKTENDKYYDRFRDRVIIPIQNQRGNFIAFGGRSLDDSNMPKYLNSPETEVFHKSKNLYGLYQAKETIRDKDSVILVEGYFDAISAHAHGIDNVVATLGTALSSDQLNLLGKYTESKRIYIAFDADAAGGSATDRGIEIIKDTFGGLGGLKILENSYSGNAFYEVRIITIPNGKDPDEFIRKNGAGAFDILVQNAPLLLDFQIEQVLTTHSIETTPGKIQTIKSLVKILSEITSPVVKSEYIKIIAEKISVSEEDLKQELARLTPKAGYQKQDKQTDFNLTVAKKDSKELIVTAEKNLLALFFLNENNWNIISSSLKEINFSIPEHQVIYNSIKQAIKISKNVEELTKTIFMGFSDDQKVMEVVSDLMFSLEDKECLEDDKLISLYIKESLACIARFNALNEERELRNRYNSVKDDEISALELQYQVRKIVNARLSAL